MNNQLEKRRMGRIETKETVIGFNDGGYQLQLTREQKIFDKYDQLLELGAKALGDESLIKDKIQYLSNLWDYVVETFWQTYCQNEPQHLDNELVFKQKTNLSRSQFNGLSLQSAKLFKGMANYAPKQGKSPP